MMLSHQGPRPLQFIVLLMSFVIPGYWAAFTISKAAETTAYSVDEGQAARQTLGSLFKSSESLSSDTPISKERQIAGCKEGAFGCLPQSTTHQPSGNPKPVPNYGAKLRSLSSLSSFNKKFQSVSIFDEKVKKTILNFFKRIKYGRQQTSARVGVDPIVRVGAEPIVRVGADPIVEAKVGRKLTPEQWDTFDAKAFIEETKQPHRDDFIASFMKEYQSIESPAQKYELVQSKIQKLLQLDRIPYDSGSSWLKVMATACKTQGSAQDQVKMTTFVIFSLEDMMSKLSKQTSASMEGQDVLYKSAEKLVTNLEELQGTFRRKNLFEATKQVDWSREVLFPTRGLGSTGILDDFFELVKEAPQVDASLSNALDLLKAPTKWDRRLSEVSSGNTPEEQFIDELGKIAAKNNPETTAQAKTASVILLWHVSQGSKSRPESLYQLNYADSARRLAVKMLKGMGGAEKSRYAIDLWPHDQMLAYTLTKVLKS